MRGSSLLIHGLIERARGVLLCRGVVLSLVLVAASCGGADDDAGVEVEVRGVVTQNSADPVDSDADCGGLDGAGRRVGFGELGVGIPFGDEVTAGIVTWAQLCNLELIVADNALDGATALAVAEQFVSEDVDAVIEFQVDGTVADQLCSTLGDIPVLAIDIPHPCAQFMGVDNAAAGELAGTGVGAVARAEWGCEVDSVVSVENFSVGSVNVERMNGALRGLGQVCAFLNLGDFEDWDAEEEGSIITRIDTSGAFVDGALGAVAEWIAEADRGRTIVVCINDDSCLEALTAFTEADDLDRVLIASMGADPSVRETVRTVDRYVGSTAIFPENYGSVVIPAIIRMMDDPTTTGPFLMNHAFLDAAGLDAFYPE